MATTFVEAGGPSEEHLTDAEAATRDGAIVDHLKERLARAEHLAGFGILAAGVAHEIATPLTVIIGHAETLLRDASDAQKERLSVIARHAEIASRHVKDLLNLAQAREIRRRPTDIRKLVDEALGAVSERARRANVEAAVTDQSEGALLLVDGDRLHQVILILVNNALDAMPSGGRVEIRLGWTTAAFTIAVQDTGCGMGPVQLARAFDPFFTTKGRGRGSGMGLHVAREIILAHGGTITASSQPMTGTCVRIDLPLRRAEGA